MKDGDKPSKLWLHGSTVNSRYYFQKKGDEGYEIVEGRYWTIGELRQFPQFSLDTHGEKRFWRLDNTGNPTKERMTKGSWHTFAEVGNESNHIHMRGYYAKYTRLSYGRLYPKYRDCNLNIKHKTIQVLNDF